MSRSRWIADVVVALWTCAWIALAVYVAGQVRQLGDLGETVSIAGDSLVQTSEGLHATSDALRAIEDLPFVGERARDAAAEIDGIAESAARTARSAQASGHSARASADDLALWLALAVALAPTVPALVAYGALRSARIRSVFVPGERER